MGALPTDWSKWMHDVLGVNLTSWQAQILEQRFGVSRSLGSDQRETARGVSNAGSDAWGDLAIELHQTTGANRSTAREWAALGRDLGWTVDRTKRLAFDLILVGVAPSDLRKVRTPITRRPVF